MMLCNPVNVDTLEHHIITLENSFDYYQPHFQSKQIEQKNKSILNCNHSDFLQSVTISMVYLLTELFLKAEASTGPCSLG